MSGTNVELIEGNWGSNVPTLGMNDYKGYDVCVDNGDMGMPEEGKPFRVAIFDLWTQEELTQESGENFSMENAKKLVESLVEGLIHWNVKSKRG